MQNKTVDIKLDEMGYPGWVVTMRTDPRSSVYDDLVSAEDGRWWKAFGQIVTSWNLTDDDDKPLPHPSEVDDLANLDLRVGLMRFIFDRYFEAVRVATAVPKAQPAPSDPSSSTSDGDQRSG